MVFSMFWDMTLGIQKKNSLPCRDETGQTVDTIILTNKFFCLIETNSRLSRLFIFRYQLRAVRIISFPDSQTPPSTTVRTPFGYHI